MRFMLVGTMVLAIAGGSSRASKDVASLGVEQVQELQARSEALLLIDVRIPQLYAQGHIEGAINVPAFALGSRRFPKSLKIVVYDGGAGDEDAAKGAQALEGAGYADVRILRGGLFRWESEGRMVVAPPGLSRSLGPRTVTPEALERMRAAGEAPVLMDTRKQAAGAGARLKGAIPAAGDALGAVRGLAQGATIVLYDDGDGSAQDAAEVLRRAGYRGVLVLYGGFEHAKSKGVGLE